MNKIKLLLKPLNTRINSLQLRERLFVAGFALVAVYFIWFFAINTPITKGQATKNQQITVLETSVTAIKDETDKILESVKKLDLSEQKLQQQQLQDQLTKLQQQMEQFDLASRSPKQFAILLQNILSQTKGLTLINVQNISLPAMETKDGKEGKAVDVFKYSVALTFKGNYFDTLSFLQDIEKYKWQVYWDEIDYVVDKYPTATITLKVHTLTTKDA